MTKTKGNRTLLSCLPLNLFTCLLVLCATSALGQTPPYHLEVYQPITSDTSPPLRELAGRTVTIPGPASPIFLGRIPYTSSGLAQADPALQTTTLSTQTYTPVPNLGFDGLGVGFPNFTVQYAPPDTNGAVGDTQYVQWVNAAFAIFNKDGTVAQGPTPGKTPWKGFGGGCEQNNDGDPIIQFDKAAHRWVFTQFSVSTKPYLQCLAVSTTPDATGPYFRFAFSFGNTDFPDYPKLGVWPDGYYMSFNIFANGFFYSGPRACAIDRSAALASTLPTMICYQLSSSIGSLLPSDLDGATPPPAGSPNYLLAFATNSLQAFKFKPNFASPSSSTLTGPATLSVAAFTPACNGGTCIPQPGTTQKLDSLADRLMYRLAYRNFSDHESLVVNHSIQTGAAASAIRWYELRIASQTPSVFQTGTYAPDALARWMGSVAMDQAGNMLVGYSTSGGSGTSYPGIRVAGRAPTDPAGTLQTETTLVFGSGSQTGGLNRWGDYSSMAVDPVDDCTFWFTTEYLKASGSFNWSTRIAQVKFANCGGTSTTTHDIAVNSISAPTSVTQGTLANVSVTVQNLGNVTEFPVSLVGTTDTGGGSLTCPTGFSLNAGASVTQTCSWNTSGATLSLHTLTATATVTSDAFLTNNAKSTSSTVTAPVVGVVVTSISPTSMTAGPSVVVTIAGSGFAAGARVTFENGSGQQPTATVTAVTSTTTISATVTAKSGGPRRPRIWDVRVTNPDGSTGVLAGAFTVNP